MTAFPTTGPRGHHIIAATTEGMENITTGRHWCVMLDKRGPQRWIRVFGTIHDAWATGAEHWGVEEDELGAITLDDFQSRGYSADFEIDITIQ